MQGPGVSVTSEKTGMTIQERQAPGKEPLRLKCFHRFADKIKPGLKDFTFFNEIGRGAYGRVYRAKCTTERQCDVAIKTVNLKSSLGLDNSSNELKVLEMIKTTSHENIIEYYGHFDVDGNRYLVFELGNCNFKEYLDKARSSLGISEFNEIAYQFFNAIDFLSEMRIEYVGYKLENMVFCSSDRMIKLIDFEQSRIQTDQYFQNPLKCLRRAGLILGKIELFMHHGTEDSAYCSSAEKFNDALRKRNFTRSDASFLEKEENIWHSKLPGKTKKLIALCFVDDDAVHLHVTNERHSLSPRKPLMLLDKL